MLAVGWWRGGEPGQTFMSGAYAHLDTHAGTDVGNMGDDVPTHLQIDVTITRGLLALLFLTDAPAEMGVSCYQA
eukprot:1594141-Rhodomonas_salina.2